MQNISKEEKNPTGFIEFLSQEYGNSHNGEKSKTLVELKKESGNLSEAVMPRVVFEPGKLQKVLDIFIEEESKNKNRIIDDVLVDSWQKATENEKHKIVASFIRKQKNKKNDWNDISELLNRNLASGSSFILDTNVWKINLVTACLFVFVLSGLITRVFPETAKAIASLGDNVINKPLYAFVYPEDIRPKNYLNLGAAISQEDLQNYIRDNNSSLPAGENSTVKVGFDKLRHTKRVAGVKVYNNPTQDLNLENKALDTIESEAEAAVAKQSIREIIIGLAEKLAEKQISISEDLNNKTKRLFK